MMRTAEQEISLLEYIRIIWKRRKAVAVIGTTLTVGTAILSFVMPKVYKADATLMPVGGAEGSGGFAALAMSQLGGLGGLLGSLGGANPRIQLMVILKSRTLAERVIEKYSLQDFLLSESPDRVFSMEEAVRIFFSMVTFKEDKKNQLLTVSTVTRDPKLSTEITNAYVKELALHINENAFTTAKRNRLFIEAQLERNKSELLDSGKELTSFYTMNRISNVVPAVDVDISSPKPLPAIGGEEKAPTLEELKGGVIRKGMPSRQTSGIPWIPEAIAALQEETGALQVRADGLKAKIEQEKVVKAVPQQVYLQYLLLRRELLGQVNALLTQQYEIAKIDESKEDLSFQVIDWARIPEKKYKPKRRQMVMIAFALSIFLGTFYALMMDYLEKVKALPSGSPRQGS